MDESKSILKDIREYVGLGSDDSSFDTDLLMHINSAIVKLNQNGVGKLLMIKDESTKWSDFKNPVQVIGNESFQMVPLYVALSTKIIFDPPPPSSVDYHLDNVKELLWRLKLAYESVPTTPIVLGGD